MKRQIVLIGLIFLRLGSAGTYPVDIEFTDKFMNTLKDKIHQLDMLNKFLSLEKEIENVYIANEDYDVSEERSPCINLGNDGCLNGYIVGSGGNKGFLGGLGSPGK